MIDLEKLEVAHSGKGDCAVSCIAGKKIVIKKKVVEKLNLKDEEIGKGTGVTSKIAFDVKEKKMYIIRQDGELGAAFCGVLSKVEIYNAKACQMIMDIIGKKLSGSGTVGFIKIDFDELANGEPCVVVDLTSYIVNPGVLVEEKSEVAE